MSEDNGVREHFLARWSRRKRGLQAEQAGTPGATQNASKSAESAEESDAFADFDFDSLNFASDYRRFMAGAVPDHVRSKALRKLWTSTDIIAQADELDDYLEDFREEAMALPAEMVRSAYRVGRGFVEGDGTGNGTAADEDREPAAARLDEPQAPSDRDNKTQADSETLRAPLQESEKFPQDSDKRQS